MSRPAEVAATRPARFGLSRSRAAVPGSVGAPRRFGGFLLRSLWVRVIVATMVLSALVMGVLGVALQSQITERLLQNKLDAAVSEVDAARQSVADNLVGAEVDPSRVQGRLNLALEQLADPAADGSSSQGSSAGVFEPVLISAAAAGRRGQRRAVTGRAGGAARPHRRPVTSRRSTSPWFVTPCRYRP